MFCSGRQACADPDAKRGVGWAAALGPTTKVMTERSKGITYPIVRNGEASVGSKPHLFGPTHRLPKILTFGHAAH